MRGRLGRIVGPRLLWKNPLHACHTVRCQIAHQDSEDNEMTPKVQRTVSAWIAAIGLVLVVMMITTEGELGALPLGLILLGAIGYVIGWLRQRAAS